MACMPRHAWECMGTPLCSLLWLPGCSTKALWGCTWLFSPYPVMRARLLAIAATMAALRCEARGPQEVARLGSKACIVLVRRPQEVEAP